MIWPGQGCAPGGFFEICPGGGRREMLGGYDRGSISCLSRQQEIRWRGLPWWS